VSDAPLIEPRTLRGFRDYLPEAMMARERLIDTARRVYRSYGFAPIDTPALEYLDILTGKGSDETDRQIYSFRDHGDRSVGMRFDLTVPLARFVAEHAAELGLPFKRYHIAAVWRGENTQRGRFREFMQCDFDTIGTLSVAADIETVLVVADLMRALGLERFAIHLNNRQVLAGMLARGGLEEKSAAVLRALDKLAKAGRPKVLEELNEAGVSAEQAGNILRLADLKGPPDQILSELEKLVAGNEQGEAGVARLAEIVAGAAAGGVGHDRLRLDPAIARGLDYYTGAVLETFLADLPAIGSVCSGGRYDNLAGLFTKQHLPGIGASLGLDRLLAAMEELGMVAKTATPAPVFIPYFDERRLADYLRLAARLRAAGIGAELFPEPKKLGQQLKYADRRGFRVALVAGENEWTAGTCQVKDLASGKSRELPLDDSAGAVIAAVAEILAAAGG
jgi:histidyl-tRNA synthetase